MNAPFLLNTTSLRRRDFLYGLGSSLGAVAMTDLLAKEAAGRIGSKEADAHA